MNILSQLFNQIAAIFKGLPLTRKIIFLLGVGGTAIFFVMVSLKVSSPEFQPLYSNLTEEDSAIIINKLKGLKIPYKISDTGTSIMVPADKKHEVRLQLAGQGLPQGGSIGFEIFDKTNLGMTNFIQKLSYQRALQGELARTISSLTEVEHARVHLVIPEKSLFIEEQRKASASVMLQLKTGMQLHTSQIQGVVHLVASSVEGLNPKDVTVVDINGRILSGTEEDSISGGLTTSQLEFQRKLERDTEGRVQTMLEQVLGQNKAIVRVSVALDFQQVERTEESFDPNSSVVRSEHRATEKTSSTNSTASGTPGPTQGQQAVPGAPTQLDNSDKRNETINYEISKITRRVIEPVGKIKSLSVAVLIDGIYKKEDDQEKYIPRTEQEMGSLKRIVEKAVGFSKDRGDQVEVVNIPFNGYKSLYDKEFWGKAEKWGNIWVSMAKNYLPLLLLAVFFFLFFFRPFMRWLEKSRTPVLIPKRLPKTVGELEAEVLTTSEAKEKELKTREESEIKGKALTLAKENPDLAAQLTRRWLSEK